MPLIYKANIELYALKRKGVIVSFEDKIREYLKVMITEGYSVNVLAKQSERKTSNNGLKKLNMTNSSDASKNAKAESKVDINLFIKDMPENKGDNYYPIVKKVKSPSGKAEIVVIGTLCIVSENNNKFYIITSEKYTNIKGKPLTINKILKIVLKDYINIINGNIEATSIRFKSKEDMFKLYKEV